MLKPSLRSLIDMGRESHADRSGTYGYLKSRERMMEQQEAKRRGMRLEFYTRRPTTPEDFQNLDILTEQPVRRGATPIADLNQFAMGGARRPDTFTGMREAFRGALERMIDAAPPAIRDSLRINSGYRSESKQRELWDAAVRKYGSEADARKWVAPPGRSFHGKGLAADLKFATAEARKWVHNNAAKYGLTFPLKNEPWHVELKGAREYRQHMDLGVGESTTAMAGLPNDVPTPMPRPPSSYPARPFSPTPSPTAIARAPLPDRFGGRGAGPASAPVMAGFAPDPARFGRTPMAPAAPATGGRVGSGSFSAPPDPARFGPPPSAPAPAPRMAPGPVDPARFGQVPIAHIAPNPAPVDRSVMPSNPGQLGGVRMSNPVGLGGPGGLHMPPPQAAPVQPQVQPAAPQLPPPTMVTDMPVHQVEAGAPPVPQTPRPPASGNTVETDQFGNRSVTNKFGATTITTPGGNQAAGSLNMGQASIPSIPGPLGNTYTGIEGHPPGFGKTLGGGLLGARMGMMGGLPGMAIGGVLGSLLGRELSKPGYGRLGGLASSLGIGNNMPAWVDPRTAPFPAAPRGAPMGGPSIYSDAERDRRGSAISPQANAALNAGLHGLY
jgi:LAS superfamily LD-carboxypeptidase LdcB